MRVHNRSARLHSHVCGLLRHHAWSHSGTSACLQALRPPPCRHAGVFHPDYSPLVFPFLSAPALWPRPPSPPVITRTPREAVSVKRRRANQRQELRCVPSLSGFASSSSYVPQILIYPHLYLQKRRNIFLERERTDVKPPSECIALCPRTDFNPPFSQGLDIIY